MLSILAPTLTSVAIRASYATVSIPPNPGGVPGGNAINSIVGGVKVLAIALCVLAGVIGGVAFAFGKMKGNHTAANWGMGAVLGAIGGAIIIGAIDALVTFGQTSGGTV